MTTEVIDIGVETLRTGIVGGGFMARVHAAAARRAGARLTALASSRRDRAESAARELGIARAEDDADGVFAASDIDVVHICTPNATHAAYAAAALAAGKHVVCEKPLATSAADAGPLASAAADARVVAAVPFVYRYHPMVREARARVDAGEVGTLLTVDGAYLQDWMLRPSDDDWRADAATGGPSRAFADIGSHLCDLIEFVTGDRIARLAARTRRVFDARGGREVANEDVAAVLFETTAGALGTLVVSQMAPGRKNALTLELHGTRRSLRFEQERPEELWVGGRKASRLLLRDPAHAAPAAARLQTLPAGHPMGYQDAFDGFIADVYAAIGGADPDGLPTFADGLRAAVLTDAVLAAAHDRTWIEVPA
ncbi:Gfo/Idh/MocA family oxidoreductase [Microbacterium sp. M3]|uniref:Gfo/Idh/MocA family oxidoreductase n=1 Tax=Microbacterium arthrosphaerae TaxID=792652 RepID=A0ABU4GX69_9MICO|nr:MULTISPECIES: Gfo/Idh/MocA family oxidoreductase [Microbacterium]MDW4571677.1 Gfo/Idh/MocA family oxidoreductase [Microbacterium arthrosphaerae]MDW7605532.1 Gfo/Idh/MocA family oxidoreductase [Microbacterium sp. M3]